MQVKVKREGAGQNLKLEIILPALVINVQNYSRICQGAMGGQAHSKYRKTLTLIS
jgi:hypothetical protein